MNRYMYVKIDRGGAKSLAEGKKLGPRNRKAERRTRTSETPVFSLHQHPIPPAVMSKVITSEQKDDKARQSLLGLGDEVPNFTCQTQVRRLYIFLQGRFGKGGN